MRILIIEDNKKTASYLKKGLTENGYIVDITYNGAEGLYFAKTYDYKLIILDIMLPVLNGWSVIHELRNKSIYIPVLFLTARDTIEDRVRGLESGADDYLIKPFSFSELLARIRNVIRHGPARLTDIVNVADLEINFNQQKVTRCGYLIRLTSKEFSLLSLLIRRKGEVLSRTFIIEQVWDINFETDTNVVDVSIRRLRNKIDGPFTKKLIQTVHGVGYTIEES